MSRGRAELNAAVSVAQPSKVEIIVSGRRAMIRRLELRISIRRFQGSAAWNLWSRKLSAGILIRNYRVPLPLWPILFGNNADSDGFRGVRNPA